MIVIYFLRRAIAIAINAVACSFVVSSAAADTFSDVDTGVDTGRFVWLRGQVIQSIQSGENFLASRKHNAR